MKKESKLNKIKRHMPIIVTRNYLNDLKDEIKQAEDQADDYQRILKDKKDKCDQLEIDINQLEKLKDKEIERLKNKISSQNEELNRKNKLLETTLKEKEEKSIEFEEIVQEVSSLKRKLNAYIANSAKQSKHLEELKERIKLLAKINIQNEEKINAKDLIIAEDTKIIEELTKKNEVQASKIQEFTKKIEHIELEYQEDGLPKPTKETLSKRKFHRKKGK